MAADTQFRRVLGPWSTGALVAGSMIGTGIFYFVAPVAERLPSRTGIMLAWVTGALIAYAGALCLAELAAAYPETGGVYVYLRRAFGLRIAFVYAWAKFLIMRTGSLAIPSLAFADFALDLLGAHREVIGAARKPVAIAVILMLTGINAAGVRIGTRVQNVMTALKMLSLTAIVGIGVSFACGVLTAHPIDTIDIPATAPSSSSGLSWMPFATALIPVMWTFGGWDEAPFVAEEVLSPRRNLPVSVIGGLVATATLFILVNAAYLAILSPAEIAASGGLTATLAMQRALGPHARQALSVALMISTFGAANGLTLTGGRIAYATGRDHPLFRWLACLHARSQTPARALLLQAALATTAIVVMSNPFDLLLYTGVAYWLFCGMTAMALIVLRVTDATRHRPFHVWLFPLVPVLFVIAALGLAAAAAFEDRRNALATLAILLSGSLAYTVQRRSAGCPG